MNGSRFCGGAGPRRPKQKRRRGFTLVELMVATTVLVVISVPVGQLFVRSSDAFTDLTTRAQLTSRGQVVMNRVLDELTAGRFVSMTPPIPEQSSWIRFERPVGFANGNAIYSNPIQIELVPVSGQPESAVRIWEDFPPYDITPGVEDDPRIVAANLAPDGLRFTRVGAILEVRMTFVETLPSEQEPVALVLNSGVKMRNSN